MNGEAILPLPVLEVEYQHMTPREPCGVEGAVAPWWSEASRISTWQCGSDAIMPFGRVELQGGGSVRLIFGDRQGWRTFVTVGGVVGPAPECLMRYGYSGSVLEDSVPLHRDPRLGRYVAIGPVLDGTLQENGHLAAITVLHPSATWSFQDMLFGYVRLGDES